MRGHAGFPCWQEMVLGSREASRALGLARDTAAAVEAAWGPPVPRTVRARVGTEARGAAPGADGQAEWCCDGSDPQDLTGCSGES